MNESLTTLQRLQAWSYRRQQLGCHAGTEPMETLRGVVAVYSSHPTAPLALLCRSSVSAAAQLLELEQERQVVRLPAMRQSIFLLPAETAPRIFAATRLPIEKRAGRLRFAGLDWNEYATLKRRVLEQVQEPITTSALQRAIKTDARLMTSLRIMTYEGLVLRLGSSLRGDSLRYVATEAWLRQPLATPDPLESLRWLAGEYLRGYGPASVEDFAWWTGVPRRRAAAALRDTDTVDIGGGLLLPADDVDAFAAVEPVAGEALDVLPKWDALTMAYAPNGRRRFLDERYRPRAYSNLGDGLPLVLRGGHAVATWSHRFAGNRMLVQVTPFEPATLPSSIYEHAFAEAGRLLGAAGVQLETSLPAE